MDSDCLVNKEDGDMKESLSVAVGKVGGSEGATELLQRCLENKYELSWSGEGRRGRWES
jgi:hypothetical protein